MSEQKLPEGTDQIVDGDGMPEDDEAITEQTIFTPDAEESVADDGAAEGHEGPSGGTEGLGTKSAFAGFDTSALFERIDSFKAQGYDQAKGYAQAGLDQASTAIDDVVRMINEAADQIDEKVGPQYGGYARKAADGIGGFGDYFKDKDVDDLFGQARELVKKSPAVAIGAAAALGFVVARLARAGLDTKASGDDGATSGNAA